MMLRRCLALLVLATVVSWPAWAQVGSTYEVRRGDTLFGIARKAKQEGVSRNQMILAIWRANQKAFPGGNINVLEVGTILDIPSRAVVLVIDSGDADRQVRDLLAKFAVSGGQIAAIKPSPSPAKPTVPSPGSEQAAKRYREGLALERKGDDRGALAAFTEAAEAGHGLAQRRLGQIYDKGNRAVRRDYQTSLRWYQKAREQGVEIDRPLPRMTTK